MKSIDAANFAANMDQYLRDSLSEMIVLTQSGRPCAVVHGLGYDAEQLELINSEEFWAMIQERRTKPTIKWDAAKKLLETTDM